MPGGRPPKPAELKVIEGNRGKRVVNFGPSFEAKGFGPPPRHLCDVAKKLWRKLAKELEAAGLAGLVYRPMLEAGCYWYAEWLSMTAIIDENGRTYETEKGYVGVRPEVTICQNAYQNMKSAFVEFGLTPSSKGKIVVPSKKERSLADLAKERANVVRSKSS